MSASENNEAKGRFTDTGFIAGATPETPPAKATQPPGTLPLLGGPAIPKSAAEDQPGFQYEIDADEEAYRATRNREATVEKVALTLAMWLGPSYEAGLLCDSDVTAMADAVVKVLDA